MLLAMLTSGMGISAYGKDMEAWQIKYYFWKHPGGIILLYISYSESVGRVLYKSGPSFD